MKTLPFLTFSHAAANGALRETTDSDVSYGDIRIRSFIHTFLCPFYHRKSGVTMISRNIFLWDPVLLAEKRDEWLYLLVEKSGST